MTATRPSITIYTLYVRGEDGRGDGPTVEIRARSLDAAVAKLFGNRDGGISLNRFSEHASSYHVYRNVQRGGSGWSASLVGSVYVVSEFDTAPANQRDATHGGWVAVSECEDGTTLFAPRHAAAQVSAAYDAAQSTDDAIEAAVAAAGGLFLPPG